MWLSTLKRCLEPWTKLTVLLWRDWTQLNQVHFSSMSWTCFCATSTLLETMPNTQFPSWSKSSQTKFSCRVKSGFLLRSRSTEMSWLSNQCLLHLSYSLHEQKQIPLKGVSPGIYILSSLFRKTKRTSYLTSSRCRSSSDRKPCESSSTFKRKLRLVASAKQFCHL